MKFIVLHIFLEAAQIANRVYKSISRGYCSFLYGWKGEAVGFVNCV